MPLITAIQPACRPITSTTITRLCDSAVVCSRSIASVAIVDRGVEAEGVVGAGEVVVDRLRDADDREVVLAEEAGRDAERVLAADRDERVEPAVVEVLQHLLDAAVELERIRPARADDRPAAGQDPRHLLRPEVAEVAVDEAAPALERGDRSPSPRRPRRARRRG